MEKNNFMWPGITSKIVKNSGKECERKTERVRQEDETLPSDGWLPKMKFLPIFSPPIQHFFLLQKGCASPCHVYRRRRRGHVPLVSFSRHTRMLTASQFGNIKRMLYDTFLPSSVSSSSSPCALYPFCTTVPLRTVMS